MLHDLLPRVPPEASQRAGPRHEEVRAHVRALAARGSRWRVHHLGPHHRPALAGVEARTEARVRVIRVAQVDVTPGGQRRLGMLAQRLVQRAELRAAAEHGVVVQQHEEGRARRLN